MTVAQLHTRPSIAVIALAVAAALLLPACGTHDAQEAATPTP
ncbi:hypothetical protein AB4Y64_11540 [Lysobacter sp. TAF61]